MSKMIVVAVVAFVQPQSPSGRSVPQFALGCTMRYRARFPRDAS